MKKPVVDNYMNEKVNAVDQNDIVKNALQTMNSTGTRKILVKDGNKLLGVLEKWKISESDLNLKVSQIKPLGKYKIVPSGTDIEKIEEDLVDYPAVFVHAPGNPNMIVGVITASDLMKSV